MLRPRHRRSRLIQACLAESESRNEKLILFVHASLDGFVAGPNGEMDWIIANDAVFEYAGRRINEGDTALYGRVTYEMMEGYWPTAAEQPDASAHDLEHSRWYKGIEKVVLSRSLKGAMLPRTRIVSDDLPAEVNAIKAEPGKDILIFGSPGAAHSLMAEDPIDGYWIFLTPSCLARACRSLRLSRFKPC